MFTRLDGLYPQAYDLISIFSIFMEVSNIWLKRTEYEKSFVSVTNSFRCQLVKCFATSLPNTMIFLVGKMREAFALQKLSHFFSTKNIGIDLFEILTFEILTSH